MRRLLALLAVVLLASVSLTSCSSGPGTVTPSEAKSLIEQGAGIIDVRTPAEFAEGHLVGAVNVDVTASDFEEKIQLLQKDATWVVYCRSGNRSADAVAKMKDLGFTDLNDAGGFADLANAGIAWE